MPSPVYSAGTPGNLIGGVSVAKQTTVAAFLDLSSCIEGQVSCEVTTGTGAPTAGTAFSAYKAYAIGAAAPIAVSSNANSTTLVVSNTTGLHVGQSFAIQQAGGSKLGEIATISAISSTTLTLVAALINTYASGDNVYLINQTATFSVTPASSAGTWAINKDYSASMFLGAGQWVIAANNTDGTQTVTVTVTSDKITGFA